MLRLGGKVRALVDNPAHNDAPRLLKISTDPSLASRLARDCAYFWKRDGKEPTTEFSDYFVLEGALDAIDIGNREGVVAVPDDYGYLVDGDIIRYDPRRDSIRVLFRVNSPHNTILLTEQCDHYCLMCSQPPKKVDDSWLLSEAKNLVRMIPQGVGEIGFSGGEPTLYGEGFVDLINVTANHLSKTSIHILSNGRRFANLEFCASYSKVSHFDKMVGIPIYSDNPRTHDYIVQSKGAFDETIRGILNLKRHGQQVEIRVVIHQQNIHTLVSLANFIARNLLFVNHVALMGLEITGFTRANLDKLWIDPYDYRAELEQAVKVLLRRGIRTSIYNHPLCLVPESVSRAYQKSISDWKNEYLEECAPCTKRNECGGFFSSGVQYRHSQHVVPFD